MTYLIAHVVRGVPEFAIAEELEGTDSDPGPWWITTGGWRAYPYWVCALDELRVLSNSTTVPLFLPEAPPDWPDFMKKQVRDTKVSRKQTKVSKIDLEELGL